MFLRIFVAAGVAALAASAALAQSWPTKPIRLLVPTGPGTGQDTAARLLADSASQHLAQPVIVENAPGASGVIAMRNVARAANDGHTMIFTGISAFTSNMYMVANPGYDPVKDFDIVGFLTDAGPFALSVPATLPARSWAEFVAYAKANAGKVSYGVDATTGCGGVAGRLINKRSGLGMTEVSYGGTPQLLQDAAAGRLQALISSLPPAQPLVDQGAIRMLAVTSAKPFVGLPNIPAMAAALPGVVVDGWMLVAAPAGSPKEAIATMNAEIKAYAARADIQTKFIALGISAAAPNSPEQAVALLKGEQARWKALAGELELKPE